MTRALLLSPQAWRDLEAIEDYTIRQWGETQAETYIDAIDEAFMALMENPAVGHKRNDLPASCRAHPVAMHLAIYRYDANTIEILNIFHSAMDIERRLKDALKTVKQR